MTSDIELVDDFFERREGTTLEPWDKPEIMGMLKAAERRMFERVCHDLGTMMVPTGSFIKHIERRIKEDFGL